MNSSFEGLAQAGVDDKTQKCIFMACITKESRKGIKKRDLLPVIQMLRDELRENL